MITDDTDDFESMDEDSVESKNEKTDYFVSKNKTNTWEKTYKTLLTASVVTSILLGSLGTNLMSNVRILIFNISCL